MTVKELKKELEKFNDNDEVSLTVGFDGDKVCNPVNLVKFDNNRVILEHNKFRELLDPFVVEDVDKQTKREVFLGHS